MKKKTQLVMFSNHYSPYYSFDQHILKTIRRQSHSIINSVYVKSIISSNTAPTMDLYFLHLSHSVGAFKIKVTQEIKKCVSDSYI